MTISKGKSIIDFFFARDHDTSLLYFLLIFFVCIRMWIILDEKGRFVSQRKEPRLALVLPHFEDNKYLCLDAPGMKTLKIDLHTNEKASKEIRWVDYVMNDYCSFKSESKLP